MKILLLDIETAPNLAYVWGLWDQNIAINQIASSGYVLCWAAKWHGDEAIQFDSVYKSKPKKMLERIWKLLDKADAVVHYNGRKFDIPTLNKEFLQRGIQPPAPYKQIDLLQVSKSAFRFTSNKLDYVSSALGIGQKVRHEGHELWVKCMAKDPEAWAKMEGYNKQDVALLEKLYEKFKPWIRNHPNHGAFCEDAVCTNCGGNNLQRRGYAVTQVMKYARYQCNDCGTWVRGNKPVNSYRAERLRQVA